MRFTTFIILLALLFVSCEKEDTAQPDVAYYLDAELVPYFERFETEGMKRGWEVDLYAAGIHGYVELLDRGVAGTCSYVPDEPHIVSIDRRFWNRSTDMEKEYVVFHELGHCFLERGHYDEALADGTCESIMESGLGYCQNNYRTQTRDTYLDELFSY